MPAPPRAAERAVEMLLPPACREEVAGDLHERCEGAGWYFVEAVRTVPLVILSRIRRVTDPGLMLMEGFLLYLSFYAGIRFTDAGLPDLEARAVVPALAALLALRVVDAYVRPGERPPLARMRDVLLAVGLPLVAQTGSSTPLRALGLGAVVSVVLVAGLRMLFPPLVNRPIGATGPAFWLRLDVDGIDISVVMLAIAALGLVVLVAIK